MTTTESGAGGGIARKAAVFDRFARYYDGDYRNYDDDIDLIIALAGECGAPILELGCGTGRVMLALVHAGFVTTGVDISPKLLELARAKLESTPATLYDFIEAELTSFDLPHKNYGLAVCTSNTLMHLNTAEEQQAMLANAYRHLAPGGCLFIDLFNPDVARLVAVDNLVELADEWEDAARRVHVTKWSVRAVDFANQLQDTLFIYEETGDDAVVRKTVCPFTLRFLWRNEAELMLRQCGFAIEEVWGHFDGEPYSAVSDRLILLARKA